MLDELKKKCAEKGVSIALKKEILPERANLFWYGGEIMCLQYQKIKCIISVIGDVCFNIRNKNGISMICRYVNTDNTGVEVNSPLLNEIQTDEDFESYVAAGLVDLINSNWVEFTFYEGEKEIFRSMDENAENLNDVFDDIDYCIEKLMCLA